MDKIIESIKNELEFCEEFEFVKNEHDQYIYESKDGKSAMNLPYILQEYKEWLIDNNIVKPI